MARRFCGDVAYLVGGILLCTTRMCHFTTKFQKKNSVSSTHVPPSLALKHESNVLASALCVLLTLCCIVVARGKASNPEPRAKTARDFGKASYVTSVFGIVVGVVILFALLIVYVLPVSNALSLGELICTNTQRAQI